MDGLTAGENQNQNENNDDVRCEHYGWGNILDAGMQKTQVATILQMFTTNLQNVEKWNDTRHNWLSGVEMEQFSEVFDGQLLVEQVPLKNGTPSGMGEHFSFGDSGGPLVCYFNDSNKISNSQPKPKLVGVHSTIMFNANETAVLVEHSANLAFPRYNDAIQAHLVVQGDPDNTNSNLLPPVTSSTSTEGCSVGTWPGPPAPSEDKDNNNSLLILVGLVVGSFWIVVGICFVGAVALLRHYKYNKHNKKKPSFAGQGDTMNQEQQQGVVVGQGEQEEEQREQREEEQREEEQRAEQIIPIGTPSPAGLPLPAEALDRTFFSEEQALDDEDGPAGFFFSEQEAEKNDIEATTAKPKPKTGPLSAAAAVNNITTRTPAAADVFTAGVTVVSQVKSTPPLAAQLAGNVDKKKNGKSKNISPTTNLKNFKGIPSGSSSSKGGFIKQATTTSARTRTAGSKPGSKPVVVYEGQGTGEEPEPPPGFEKPGEEPEQPPGFEKPGEEKTTTTAEPAATNKEVQKCFLYLSSQFAAVAIFLLT